MDPNRPPDPDNRQLTRYNHPADRLLGQAKKERDVPDGYQSSRSGPRSYARSVSAVGYLGATSGKGLGSAAPVGFRPRRKRVEIRVRPTRPC